MRHRHQRDEKLQSKPMPANLWLGIMKFLMVPPTQPIMVIKGRQQTALLSKNPRVLSIRQAIREIRLSQSNAAFFKGAWSAAFKEFFRNTVYKGPLIQKAPHLAEKWIAKPTAHSQHYDHVTRSLAAGAIAGFAENIFGGIFETISTFQLTAQGRYARYSFYQELQKQPSFQAVVSRLYRGFIPSTIKSSVAFTTYFLTAPYLKSLNHQLYAIDKNTPMPWYGTFSTAMMSGFLVASLSTPFDIVKTQMQRPGAVSHSMFKTMVNNYYLHGSKHMTTGLGMNLSLVTLGWFINFLVLEEKHGLSQEQTPVHTLPK